MSSPSSSPEPELSLSPAQAPSPGPAPSPLQRPDHLTPPPPPALGWLRAHAFGLAALVLGATSFIVVFLAQPTTWSQPDLRLAIPFFVATMVPAVIAVVRKEPAPVLPILGFVLATVTLVLGLFLLTLAVVIGAVMVCAILASVMS